MQVEGVARGKTNIVIVSILVSRDAPLAASVKHLVELQVEE